MCARGDDAINEQLGRRLRLRRRALGMTQQAVAAAIGVRFQQVHKYESGASRMSPSRLFALSAALGVPIDYFFTGLTEGWDLTKAEAPRAIEALEEVADVDG